MSGNVRLAFGTILKNLRKSLENDQKSLENRQKRCHQHVYIKKKTGLGLPWPSEDVCKTAPALLAIFWHSYFLYGGIF